MTDRKFLTVSDATAECESAAMFAAMRAKAVGAGLVIMRVAQVSGFGHWRGLDEEMRAEARDNALYEATQMAMRVAERVGIQAEVVIREVQAVAAISDVVDSDEAIKTLVLAAGAEKGGPGPLVSRIGKGKPLAGRPIAITVIPGNLSDRQLAEMGGMAS